MTKKYEWKLESFAKGIDPAKAVKELKRIERVYGDLTPENILAASTPEDALFHSLFTWDNEAAADQYRLSQARKILNNVQVHIISDGEPKVIPVYEVVRVPDKGNVYKHVQNFDENDIEQIKGRTLRELNALKSKLTLYSQFERAVQKLDEATDEISNIT